MMYGYGWWASIGFITMVTMVGVVVWMITTARPEPVRPSGSKPLSELAERYARGDIDRDEFRARKSIIEETM
jgi:uncharacterized membrane protein